MHDLIPAMECARGQAIREWLVDRRSIVVTSSSEVRCVDLNTHESISLLKIANNGCFISNALVIPGNQVRLLVSTGADDPESPASLWMYDFDRTPVRVLLFEGHRIGRMSLSANQELVAWITEGMIEGKKDSTHSSNPAPTCLKLASTRDFSVKSSLPGDFDVEGCAPSWVNSRNHGTQLLVQSRHNKLLLVDTVSGAVHEMGYSGSPASIGDSGDYIGIRNQWLISNIRGSEQRIVRLGDSFPSTRALLVTSDARFAVCEDWEDMRVGPGLTKACPSIVFVDLSSRQHKGLGLFHWRLSQILDMR